MDQINQQRIWKLRKLGLVPNTLTEIIETFSDCYCLLINKSNPNITLDYVSNLPQTGCGDQELSRNPNLTFQYILDHPEITWNIEIISKTLKITVQDIIDHLELDTQILTGSASRQSTDFLGWMSQNKRYFYPSSNPYLAAKDIFDHPELPWNYKELSCNPCVTFKDILYHIPQDPDRRWGIDNISKNPSLTIRDLTSNPVWSNWNWYDITQNPGITFRDIKDHPELPWDYEVMAYNPNVTLTDLLSPRLPEYEHILKQWNVLSQSPSITFKDVINNPDIYWDWSALGCNPHFVFRDIEVGEDYNQYMRLLKEANQEIFAFLLRPWNRNEMNTDYATHYENMKKCWSTLCSNPNILPELVINDPRYPLDMINLSRNPNLTVEFIQTHTELPSESLDSRNSNSYGVCLPWDWQQIGKNEFELDPVVATRLCHKYAPKSGQFKKELSEAMYRPGFIGYQEAKTSFNSLIS